MDHFELFFNKCYEGNFSAVEAFISEGVSPDVQNAEGETALQISAANCYLDIVKFLLKKGATIDLPNNYGWTPLMHAAKHGHIEIVSYLIQMRAKVNVNNRLGLRPIDLAVWSGNLSCVKLIVEAGAIIDNDQSLSSVQSDVCDISPLMAASLQGHDFVVRTLLEKGSAINQASSITGLTALMLAASIGYKSIVEILIQFDGDANKTDICGRTALDFAVMEHKEDVVRFLKDVTQPNSRKLSDGIPDDINILRVVRSGDVVKVKSLLMINPNLANFFDPEDGVTPLMTACMLGFNNIVDILISNGANLNAQDVANSWTPLMYAVFHRQTETVFLLLDKGVDIDICTANGYTAFDLAIHTDDSENKILNALLAYSESELLDTVDNLAISPCSTSYLTTEKATSRNDSQQSFRELLGGLSSHFRQFSKSSAVSPIPDSENFDESLYDVFLDDNDGNDDNEVVSEDTSTKKNFLCLSKFYAPNEHFAYKLKQQVEETIYLPPLPCHNTSIDLVKTICPKKDKASTNISSKPRFNSLCVPNLIRSMKKVSSAFPNHVSEDCNILPESLNLQDSDELSEKSVIHLESKLLLQLEESNLEETTSISECSTLKDYSEFNQETLKDSAGLSYKNPKPESNSVDETATGGLTALLSQRSLENYAKIFRDQEIDLECFQYLTEDDLDEMGISSFDSRHKLMEIIDKLKNS